MKKKQFIRAAVTQGSLFLMMLTVANPAHAAQVLFQGLSTVDPNVQSTFTIDAEITNVGTNSFWTTYELTVQLEAVTGVLNATIASVQDVSGALDYVFAGTSASFSSFVASDSLTAGSSDETSLEDGVPASLDNPLMARFVIDISGTGPGQQFKISLCETGAGCLNTNVLEGFDDNSIPRIDAIVADDKIITVAAVPIPAAAWLFASALGLLGWLRRKAT